MGMRSPLIFELKATADAVATASGVQSVIIGEVQESATVTEVSILPASAVVASTTNYRTFTLFNRGTAGTGTVSVATLDTSVTGLTDNDERLATLATAANLALTADAVLELVETVASAGVAHGGYTVVVKASRTP